MTLDTGQIGLNGAAVRSGGWSRFCLRPLVRVAGQPRAIRQPLLLSVKEYDQDGGFAAVAHDLNQHKLVMAGRESFHTSGLWSI